MKTRLKNLYILLFLGISALASGQSASIVETLVDEGSVRNATDYIIEITLDRDTFITTDPAKTALLNGLKGSSTAFDAVVDAIDLTDIAFTDADTVATITINQFAGYYITRDDSIGLTIPLVSLKSGVAIALTDSIIITNLLPTVTDGGDLDPSANESDIRSGSNTYILSLDENLWRSDIESAGAALTAVKAIFSSTEFAPLVTALSSTDLNASPDFKDLTITFAAKTDFYIPSNSVVNVTVTQDLLEYPESFTSASESFTINNEAPTITITDETYTELDIRTGPVSFDITLDGDVWADPLSTDFKDRIDGDGSVWDATLRSNLTVSRQSSSVVQVTIPQTPSFDISISESVTITVLAADLDHSTGGPFSVTGTKTIDPISASIVAGGTIAAGIDEADMRSGSHTITVSLFEDDWVAGVGSYGAEDTLLVNSITSSSGSVEWNSIKALILSGDNVSAPVNGVVTITVPEKSDYDITSDMILSIDVPASLIVNSGSSLADANFATISVITPYVTVTSIPATLSEASLDGATITVKLHETIFNDLPLTKNHFTLIFSENTPGVSIISDDDITPYGNDSATIIISFNGTNFDTDRYMGVTVEKEEILGGSDIPSALSIPITAISEPQITAVDIPDIPMGFGTTVTATITVDDVGIDTFTFVQGTVAGRSLYNFQNVNSSTYTVDFDIIENSSPEYHADSAIDVTNLQLKNGTSVGNIYTGVIVGSNDPIDTHAPVVDLISFNNGTYKIGDQIITIIHALEPNLTFDSSGTTVNNVPLSSPNLSWHESGSGIYEVTYVVEDGEDDVTSGITASVVMVDGVGNKNIPYTTVGGSSPIIDANYPDILSATVTSSGVKIPGDIIVINVVALEENLNLITGSHVNNVTAFGTSEGEIDFVDNGDSTYTITYTVGSDDDEVATNGDMTYSLIFEDQAGNRTVKNNNLLSNNVTIVTTQPTAYIYGGGNICPGGSAKVFVSITGNGPFNIEVSDGVNPGTTPYNNIGTSFSFDAAPGLPDAYNYTIATFTDALGYEGIPSGSAQVVLNPNPTPQIDPSLRLSYQDSEDSIQLSANPSGGVFTGKGVVSSENMFYPSIASTAGSPHRITYTYTDPATGCTGTDFKDLSVVVSQAEIVIDPPNNVTTLCYNDDPVEVTGSNTTGVIPGNFYVYQVDQLGGLYYRPEGLLDVDGADNKAQIIPAALGGGSYRVYYFYYYLDVSYTYIFKNFIIDEPGEIKFTSPTDDQIAASFEMCIDQNLINLKSTLDDPNRVYSFSGNGVTGNEANGYVFNPELSSWGYHKIDYEFTSQAGCKRDRSFYITVYDVPKVGFTPTTKCISQDGGPIEFNNTTDLTGKPSNLVSEWRWNFGDEESGKSNTIETSTKTNPIHDYTAPDTRDVSLEIITINKCVARFDTTIVFPDQPVSLFNWESDCYLDDVGVKLYNYSVKENTALKSFDWKMYDGGSLLDSIRTTSLNDTVEYQFDRIDNFTIEMVAINDSLCSDTLTRELYLKPTVSSDTLVTFDVSDGSWSPYAEDFSDVNSWVLGEPDFSGFETVAGDEAWFTQFDETADDRFERSWIQSPCFDFRMAQRPMIRMDIMGSFDNNRDGAVVQYSVNNGKDWNTVGTTNEGINWYNSFEIIEKPGGGEGSNIGWSGESGSEPDSVWVTAAHDLDVLTTLSGNENVIFGIFYATDGASIVGNQGFAVDNIYIGERTKRALIEHFTNSGAIAAQGADLVIDTFTSRNSLDVTNLQYHMHYPDEDEMNENNSSPSSSRSFYYGISDVPYALMDGGIKPNYQYNFTPSEPTAIQLKELTLESPLFEMDLNFQLYANRLAATANFTALQEIDSSDIILNVAVVEKKVNRYTGLNGDDEFHNVVLDMLPTPAGTLYAKPWFKGETASKELSWSWLWPYGAVEDFSNLMLVAFLQNRETGKILQVTEVNDSDFGLETALYAAGSINIYPNPARDLLYIELEKPVGHKGVLEITDMTGRVIQMVETSIGDQYLELNISNLTDGAYILQNREDKRVISRTNFIKVE